MTRRYESPVRRAAEEETRRRILDALATELAEGPESLVVSRVAERAGVGVRTVYHHFPDRPALLAALDEHVNKTVLLQPEYTSPEALVAGLREEFLDASENAVHVRAMLASPLGHQVRARSRGERAARVEAALTEVLDGLPDDQRRRALAIILLLRSAETWRTLYDDLGLDAEEGAEAVAWAVETLIDDLRTRSRRSRTAR